MHNNAVAFVMILVAAFLAACSGEYEQSRLDLNSPQAAKVNAMIADLRDAGPDGMEAVIARDGVPEQADALKQVLLPIAQADDVQLTRLMAYGDNILAVNILLTTDGQQKAMNLLLKGKGKNVQWLGMQ